MLCVSDPDAPVKVNWKEPLDVCPPVTTVTVETWLEPFSITEFGEGVQVTVVGAPEQLMDTVPVNPLTGVTVNLTVAESGDARRSEEGEVESEKSIPVPESAAVCGLPGASSVTDRVPLRVPLAVGLNVT
jgi:hypothetical protein